MSCATSCAKIGLMIESGKSATLSQTRNRPKPNDAALMSEESAIRRVGFSLAFVAPNQTSLNACSSFMWRRFCGFSSTIFRFFAFCCDVSRPLTHVEAFAAQSKITNAINKTETIPLQTFLILLVIFSRSSSLLLGSLILTFATVFAQPAIPTRALRALRVHSERTKWQPEEWLRQLESRIHISTLGTLGKIISN
jgi:hypothetical protein